MMIKNWKSKYILLEQAIGPSWTLYKVASLKSILDAADWNKESSFTQFYLRNFYVEVLKQKETYVNM